MRYISLFSGIEAASVAWEPLGWEPMAFSEIEPFPSAVLAKRWPNVPNLGDITRIDWREFVEANGRPDVVVGGSPCQSFSIAAGANRTSLGGKSNLMYEYIRACSEIRSRWILWENVPGVLNTKDDAFGQLITSLQDVGYVDIAWRVLDSQFFGVAQRRRRVYVVGHLGDSNGCAAAVLFERKSVRGNIKSSKQKRAEIAAGIGSGTKNSECIAFDRSQITNPNNRSNPKDTDPSPTLLLGSDLHIAYSFKYHQGVKAGGVGFDQEVSPTLIADYHNPAVICMSDMQAHSSVSQDVCGALTAHNDRSQPIIASIARPFTG